ncbi:hypothetical protein ACOSQ3_013692 [Xanthoceras sorbifolium]
MDGAKVELEIQAMDQYKRSSAFDAFMYQEFANRMKESHSFLEGLVDLKPLENFDVAALKN